MYLLYCIMKTPLSPPEPDVAGLGGSPVFLTSCNGLSAVLSELSPAPGLPESRDLLDYHRIIEDFHFRYGVIPVRYGCCFRDPSHVHDLLRQQARQYRDLLDELAGNVEMGIRIRLLPDQDQRQERSSILPAWTMERNERQAPAGSLTLIGREYLTTLRTHYAKTDKLSRQYTQMAADYAQVFALCTRRHAFEAHEGNDLLSLYFLVPALNLERFRETFRATEKGVKEKVLMSGPWPPYNFAKIDCHTIRAAAVL